MFSRNRHINNLKSRHARAEDIACLREPIMRLAKDSDIILAVQCSDGMEGSIAITAFVEVILVMQMLIEKGKTFKEIFDAFAANQPLKQRYGLTELGRALIPRLRHTDPHDQDRLYWLALWGILREASPAFLSPVASSHELLAAMLTCGQLCVPGEYSIDVPHLVIDDRQHLAQDWECVGGYPTATTVWRPETSSNEGVAESVRFWFQRSLNIAERVQWANAPYESTNR